MQAVNGQKEKQRKEQTRQGSQNTENVQGSAVKKRQQREKESEDTAVFNLCPFTVSYKKPLCEGVSCNYQPPINCSMFFECVCQHVSAGYLSCFPSHDQHSWNSFRLGSHFTVLPKKASLLQLSQCPLCAPSALIHSAWESALTLGELFMVCNFSNVNFKAQFIHHILIQVYTHNNRNIN